ncbi:MAG: MCE family protein [Nocardiopsaceae bacterium]|jgi:phospholipid/cholesterol/gamma-HCH transport system substrate-binding protein|nr:MCE family protein [Nocardiopsaceae bacterium]
MRRAVLAAAAAAAALTLTACSSNSGFQGIYSLPLPGGASLGSHPYTVKAAFANVVDLVPQAAVRVNDVAVGRVTGLSVPRGSWNAVVTMQINGRVRLPANATAQLAQSSLFGDQYVALAPPPGLPGRGRLAPGATIPVYRTTANVTVEAVLGALSALLNGGGLAQLHSIDTELNRALHGNVPQVRSVLKEITGLVSNLDAHRHDITNALDGINQLAHNLRARDRQIGYVLDHLAPGAKVFTRQLGQLQTMLNALHRLSNVAVDTINKSAAQATADLQALNPILRNLANAGSALPRALQVLFTFPFPNQVLRGIGNSDYLNAYLRVVAQKGTCVIAPLTPGDQAAPSPAPSGRLTCPPQP